MLVEAGLIVFSDASFEFADEGLEKTQHGSLVDLPRIFLSHFNDFSEVVVVEFCAQELPRLFALSPCFAQVSLHNRIRALTLFPARALRVRCQFGLSGKHDTRHVGVDVTDVGAVVG